MQQTPGFSRRAFRRRAVSFLLALALALGLIPGFPGGASGEASAHWADPYLSQLVEWGFIRADQAENPDLALTRADFMAIVNRAYGYHEPGPTPFTDVSETDWYYDDVGIAYNARYINGTSPTTASPNSTLDRETATTILGRNMMLQESAGEILDFTDARQISNWAQGTIKSSMEHYLVSGYDDGTFRPQRSVSWGEMAALISRTIGTPLQEAGDYSLGGVFGNVTVSSPGVTLRDTVISGDLYISGGVGLGGIKLENVTVLGRIIASGTGASEGGASILLRNVTADELLVDNLRDNEVSIRADGITEIGKTTVRTSAYIEDNTPDGLGLHMISLEGDSYGEDQEPPEGWAPARLTLAGRIGEVINRTPYSTVHAASGTVARLTVDEEAVGSEVVIDRGTVVRELVLDTGVNVTGEGDIVRLEVNAPGCDVVMLPDEIEIRPGLTAFITGEEMDSVGARESTQQPMILAGYPEAQDIVPTGLDAMFKTNKSGTVYWAVSAITSGSIGEEDLIKPPSYGNVAVRNGSVRVLRGNEETLSRVTGLTPGGSYYLSAVLVDARGQRSSVKVISFTTPDNTKPAFCAGYPHMSSVSPKDSVVVVMPTKDCRVYYALMPQSALAPTADELQTGAVAGALGYGVQDLYKNQESTIRVNDVLLEEKTAYVLYLWLTDGVNGSAVTSLTFTTTDETPPKFIVDPTVTDVKANGVSMTFRLDEDGVVYWVAVPAGTVYPKPEPGTDYDSAPLDTDYAKLQIISGMNIGSNGKSGRVNARENADGTITISGLLPEASYDFYYVAVDTAGNRSHPAKKVTFNTLDTTGPKFTQSFSHVSGTDKTRDPMSDTAIYLDVSENVRYDGEGGGKSFLEIYQETQSGTQTERNAAVNRLASCLYNSIRLHKVNTQDNSEETIIYKYQTADTRDEWTIDYTQAKVTTLSSGGIRIEFPSAGLHLENGGEYYFTIESIRDVSNNQNELVPETVDFFRNQVASAAAGHYVPPFEVEMPRVDFSNPGVSDGPIVDSDLLRIDMSFRMQPVSTETVNDSISYDVLLWTGNQLEFDLYYRVVDELGRKITDSRGAYPSTYKYKNPNDETDTADITDYLLPQYANSANRPDANGWILLGNSGAINPTNKQESGRSVNKNFNGCGSTTFPLLKNLSSRLRYEFVIHITRLGVIPEVQNNRETWRSWNENVVFHVNVAAGQSNNLNGIASDGTATNPGGVTETRWKEALDKKLNGGALSIGRWYDANNQEQKAIELSYRFTDSRLPSFTGVQFPDITPTSAKVEFRMSTPGTVYWMVGRADSGTNQTAEITTTRTLMKNEDGTTAPGEASTNQVDAVTNAEQTGALLELSGSDGEYHIRLTDKHGTSSLAPPDPTQGQSMQPWMLGTADTPPVVSAGDDPETPNLIVNPDKNWVMSPSSNAGTADAIHGSKAAEGYKTEGFTIEGLTPERNYYLYVVVKGESDTLSHVYLYQFTTPKSIKPKLQLGWRDPNATIRADRERNGLRSYVNYVVFTLSDAKKISKLNQPLKIGDQYGVKDASGNLKLPSSYQYSTLWPDDPTHPYTVLDALIGKYRASSVTAGPNEEAILPAGSSFENYSVFDIFADSSQKGELSDFLRGGFQTEFLGANVDYVDYSDSSFLVTSGTSTNRKLDIKAEGTDHVIIGVAWAEDAAGREEDIDSYAAYTPIHIGKATYPAVDTGGWYAGITGGVAADTLFPGEITFSLTQPIYVSSTGAPLNDINIFDIGTWTSGIGGSLKDRLEADVITDRTSTSVTLRSRNSSGWANGDHIRILGGQWTNVNDMSCQEALDIWVTKTATGVTIKLQYGSASRSFTYLFEKLPDVTLTIVPPTGEGIYVEGELTGTQTLYVDSITTHGGKLTFGSSIYPPQYEDNASYTWTSTNTNVLALGNRTDGTRDDGKAKSAVFDIVGTGQTTIRLNVSVTLPNGEMKTGMKEITVYVGNSLTFTSARGSGVTKNGDTVDVRVTVTNPNPTVTFVFTSVSPMASSIEKEVTFTPDDAFSKTFTSTLSTNGKTLTVSAMILSLPSNPYTVKLKVGNGEISYEVTINISGTQSGMVTPAPAPNP